MLSVACLEICPGCLDVTIINSTPHGCSSQDCEQVKQVNVLLLLFLFNKVSAHFTYIEVESNFTFVTP